MENKENYSSEEVSDMVKDRDTTAENEDKLFLATNFI
jgi:hypothetical protein